MKTLISLILILSGVAASAGEVKRLAIPTVDNIKIDTFVYLPDNLKDAKGIILTIGGSGLTRGGFGGPANFSQLSAANNFIGVEWNKRGITTSTKVDSAAVDFAIYNTATIENIVVDGGSVLEYMRKAYPHLPVFVLGGSEGSVTTTLLAEYFPKDIKAVATFGNVIMPFVQTTSMQITDVYLKKMWPDLDANKDQSLSPSEISTYKPKSADLHLPLQIDFAKADLSADGALSFDEMAMYLVNYFMNENPNPNYWYETSGVAGKYLDSMFRTPPLTSRAYNISIPVFIAQGEDDWNTPAKDVYQFQVQCKTSRLNNFSFKYYAKVGHAPSKEMFSDFLSYFESFVPAK